MENIPEYLKVTGTELTAFKEDTPEKVVIPEGITHIEHSGLRPYREDEKDNSEEFVIPQKRTWLITDITIPASVVYIYVRCAPLFKGVKTVRYRGTLAQWCAISNNASFVKNSGRILLDDGTDIKTMTSLAIPEGVTGIGSGAFSGFTALASVSIPKSVEVICRNAFFGCSSLESVSIPEGVKGIVGSAFSGCTALTRLDIPASVKEIGGNAFRKCPKLKEVRYGGTKEQWREIREDDDYLCFDGGVTIHCSDGDIVTPQDEAPWGIRKNSILLEILMEKMFDNLKIEGTVVTGVEEKCKAKIKSIVIPKEITAIGEGAFMWCGALEEIWIPCSVSEIHVGSFAWCTNLKTVRYDGTLAQWYAIDNNSTLVAQVEHVFLNDGTDIKAMKEIVIPEGVAKIGIGTFYGCFLLERVILPESLKSLPSDAFFSRSILKAEFGGTKEQWLALGNNDFTSVACKDGVVGIKDIPPYLVIWGSQMNGFKKDVPDAIVIPEGVTAINAVEDEEKEYHVQEVTIPASVKYVETGVFFCCKDIKTVHYSGTLAQWREIEKDVLQGFKSAVVIHCSDGDIA